MIKIVKGNDELIVSNLTYKTMFKDLGYVIANEGAVKSASSQAKINDEVKKIDTLKQEKDKLLNKKENDLKIDSDKDEGINDILDIISSKNNKKNNKKK